MEELRKRLCGFFILLPLYFLFLPTSVRGMCIVTIIYIFLCVYSAKKNIFPHFSYSGKVIKEVIQNPMVYLFFGIIGIIFYERWQYFGRIISIASKIHCPTWLFVGIVTCILSIVSAINFVCIIKICPLQIFGGGQNCFLTREETNVIKGIALIFMFAHHFFTFPDWWMDGINYPILRVWSDTFCESLKMCVPLFAFLTGYLYPVQKDKSMKRSLNKIVYFLRQYWLIYMPLFLIAIVTGSAELNIKDFLLGMIGLDTKIMIFCWYVYYFIILMLVLPVIHRMYKKNPPIFGIFIITLITVLIVIINWFKIGNVFDNVIYSLWMWLPVSIVGYLCSVCNTFEAISKIFQNKHEGIKILLCLLIGIWAFMGRRIHPFISLSGHQIISMDIFYTPCFILCLVGIYRTIKIDMLWTVVSRIGKQSMYMWFIHCVFFDCFKKVLQPILYVFDNPVFVLIWGLLICYAGACVLCYIEHKIFSLHKIRDLISAKRGRDE